MSLLALDVLLKNNARCLTCAGSVFFSEDDGVDLVYAHYSVEENLPGKLCDIHYGVPNHSHLSFNLLARFERESPTLIPEIKQGFLHRGICLGLVLHHR